MQSARIAREPRHRHRTDDHRRRLAEGDGERVRHVGEVRIRAQERDDQHHRDDAEVLKNQRADDESSVRSVELTALCERSQNDSRAREREDEAV